MFMKDLSSSRDSNIHKHFPDKRLVAPVAADHRDPGDLSVKVHSSLDLIRSRFSGCECELKDL